MTLRWDEMRWGAVTVRWDDRWDEMTDADEIEMRCSDAEMRWDEMRWDEIRRVTGELQLQIMKKEKPARKKKSISGWKAGCSAEFVMDSIWEAGGTNSEKTRRASEIALFRESSSVKWRPVRIKAHSIYRCSYALLQGHVIPRMNRTATPRNTTIPFP